MSLMSVDKFCKSKICNMGLHVVIQKNVAALNVPMDNMRNAVVMQVTQASGNSQSDSKAQFPVDGFPVVVRVICEGNHR